MKKYTFLSIMIALLLTLALSACGEKNVDPGKESGNTPTSTQTAETTAAKTTTTTTPKSATTTTTSAKAQTTVETTTTPVPSSQPAQTTVPTSAPGVVNAGSKPDFGPLSDDPYDFQIEINGDVYQFPMTYAQFTSYGWVYKNDEEKMLDAKYYTVGERFTMGDLSCTAHFVNMDVSAVAYKNSYIGGIDIDSFSLRDATDAKIVLSKGITYAVSTADEVRSAYGTPSNETKLSSGTEILEYKQDYEEEVKLTFNSETKLLSDIRVRNYTTPEDFVPAAVSDEVPEIVKKYEPPTQMTDNFGDWIVTYGGKLYRLPAPLSEFVDDGWVINEKESKTVIDGRGSGRVELRKDNQKVRVYVINYSENATAVTNCFMTNVLSDSYDAKIPLVIAKGIAIGTPEAEVKTAIAGEEVEESDSTSYTLYRVKVGDTRTFRYEIYINKESGNVYKIDAQHDPRYRDFVNE